MARELDMLVIGGGIVGLAVAWKALEKNPTWKVAVVEKEPAPARHQTGHNSGVIHSGIYYAPGSQKARTCREGRAAMEAFCEREGLPWRRCGKVIAAVEEAELPGMEALLERGRANGVDCERVDAQRLRELEPHAAGIAAIHVKETGVTDYAAVSLRLAERLREKGAELRMSTRVVGIQRDRDPILVETDKGELRARRVVNCAGLHSDQVARFTGKVTDLRIVPFRGEYRLLRPEARHLVRALIYPVPDPKLPFLGVHFTRTVHDEVKAGPTAVLALKREGYRASDVNLVELAQSLLFPGTRRMMKSHLGDGLREMRRASSERAFLQAARRLVPELGQEDLLPGPSGVRAQAVSREGALLDDFALKADGPVLHVLNAPSPAATASLAIADQVVAQLG